MPETITSGEMRALEQAAIESGRVTGLELMERAGAGVVEAIFEEWPELAQGPHKAVVLCGPGNNGGDGFVVARLLRALGWKVEVFFYGIEENLPPDARENYDLWCSADPVIAVNFPNVSEADIDRFEEAAYLNSATELIVDALFGIGLSRPIDGLSPLFGYNDIEMGVGKRLMPARHVSVDIPTGLKSDSAKAPGYLGSFLTDLTVTFHRAKPVHVDISMQPFLGKTVVKDIGL